jgi:hypothetical protein
VDADKKFDLLIEVVKREQPRQCLIFVERKRWADNLYRDLKRHVPAAAVIHGDLPQSHRERIMAAFRTGEIKYLIATDVMSRGIDVSDLSHVINFDLPLDIESYVHRIGRTGRIGRDGIAISFATPEQGGLLTDIEMMINKLIDHDDIPGRQWYTSRRVEQRKNPPMKLPDIAEQVASVRADSGWGIDEEDLTGGKLGVAEGELPPAERVDQPQGPVLGPQGHPFQGRGDRIGGFRYGVAVHTGEVGMAYHALRRPVATVPGPAAGGGHGPGVPGAGLRRGRPE